MRWRPMVRAAVLAGLLLTPSMEAAAGPLRSTVAPRLSAELPRWIDAVWRLLPWMAASSDTSSAPVLPVGETSESSPEGSQDGAGGPGWDPDGLTTGADDGASSESGSES